MTLDKLPAIRGDLVRTDPDLESWDFVKLLTDALRHWDRRNPVNKNAEREREENKRKQDYYNRLLQARGGNFKIKGCVYCGDENHKAVECNKVTDIIERKRILAQKGLCFNCATRNHRAWQNAQVKLHVSTARNAITPRYVDSGGNFGGVGGGGQLPPPPPPLVELPICRNFLFYRKFGNA